MSGSSLPQVVSTKFSIMLKSKRLFMFVKFVFREIIGSILQKVLSALDALDKHNFDKVDSSNSLDTLYSQIFPNPPVKENPIEADAPIVLLLCKWAVGFLRSGEHRALAVAKLLEHRQSDILSSTTGDTESQNQNQSGSSEAALGIKVESPDDDAPMLDCENAEVASGTSSKVVNGGSSSANNNDNEDNEFPNGLPVFHNLLLRFLDEDAPTLGKWFEF